ncbi:unnamed protein product [Urochloa humidicola]
MHLTRGNIVSAARQIFSTANAIQAASRSFTWQERPRCPAAQAAGPSSAAPALHAAWAVSWRAAGEDLSPTRHERRPKSAVAAHGKKPRTGLLVLLVLVAIVTSFSSAISSVRCASLGVPRITAKIYDAFFFYGVGIRLMVVSVLA